MRVAVSIALAGALLLPAATVQAQNPPSGATLNESFTCGKLKTPKVCGVSKKDLDSARQQFDRGLKLRKDGDGVGALEAFKAASDLVPRDLEYATAKEIAKQQLVLRHIELGNALIAQHQAIQAAAAFGQALEVDPQNQAARQGLQEALQSKPPSPGQLRIQQASGAVYADPSSDKKSFHFKGDSRTLLEQVAAAFGMHATFDESVRSRQVRMDIEAVNFETAMEAAEAVTKTFWVPLSAHEILVANDAAAEHQEYDRMVMRTFYFPQATSATELNDILNALRTVFEIRFVVAQPENRSISVRAPSPLVEAATRFLKFVDAGRPQVMLEMQVFQVSRTVMRSLGLELPLQWQAFNVGQEALALLAQPNVQDLINQLFASGGINQANSSALTALLGQLQSQQNSLLSQPFATFGGGSTLTAVPVPPLTAHFSRNESMVKSLEKLTLRASQSDPAVMRIGERYPILNATFAPIFNSPALSQVIQTGTFTAPFPSFTYEDLGISVKATPYVHGEDVTLQVEVEIKSLGAQSFNGVPVISNRAYTGVMRIRDGTAGVVAGTLDSQEQRSLSGVPGLSLLPGLGYLGTTANTQHTDSEILLVITPRIVSEAPSGGQTLLLSGF